MAMYKICKEKLWQKVADECQIYQNLHSFEERVILLCHIILEKRKISHLHGSALFTIPLRSKKANGLEI